jgi:ParB/RepB/Spo0J family partition protein
MENEHVRKTTLPDGDVVEISDTPCAWWATHRANGFVDPHVIAPDPKQPRRHMDLTELAELQESITVTGVRQPMVVTPRANAPWITVNPEHEDCFFAAVSGHRRRECALNANLEAVPIEVRIYPSSKEHYMDASVLNTNHTDLTPLEEGYEMVRLRSEGWTVEELCRHFGTAAPQYYVRISLTQLHPGIQELLNPAVQEKKRLPATTAGALGNVKVPTVKELDEVLDKLGPDANPNSGVMNVYFEDLDDDGRRFELQWMLLRVILKRKYQSVRAINFIREHSLKLAAVGHQGGKKTKRYRPEKQRAVVLNLAKTINQSVLVDWPPAEFKQAFSGSTAAELEEHIAELRTASEAIDSFLSVLLRIQTARRPVAA